MLPFGFLLGVVIAAVVWVLYARTRFGFEVQVIGDSPRAARYAGMRTRRKILAVMALSGAIAGIGGASQDGDFRHLLDPRGLTDGGLRLRGHRHRRARAATTRSPSCLVAFLLGGLQNAGYTLQGADFPSGLVGVHAGADPLLRARRRAARPLPRSRSRAAAADAAAEPRRRDNNSILVVVLASAVIYGTPLLYAALGELLAERSGVLNLGVEGMMLVGAVMGFWAVQRTGLARSLAAVVVAAVAGARWR